MRAAKLLAAVTTKDEGGAGSQRGFHELKDLVTAVEQADESVQTYLFDCLVAAVRHVLLLLSLAILLSNCVLNQALCRKFALSCCWHWT